MFTLFIFVFVIVWDEYEEMLRFVVVKKRLFLTLINRLLDRLAHCHRRPPPLLPNNLFSPPPVVQ